MCTQLWVYFAVFLSFCVLHRAVAEREAARLAKPERSHRPPLAHANRKQSAVSSTPFGVFSSTTNKRHNEQQQNSSNDSNGDNLLGWCGPFSVARQMIANREEAKRKREENLANEQTEHHPLDAIMVEYNLEEQRKIHPSMKWKSNLPCSNSTGSHGGGTPVVAITSIYAKRQRRVDLSKGDRSRVSSLFQLAVDFIVDNFSHVESLGEVDNDIRSAIAKELVARNKLDSKSFESLVQPTTLIETLEIEDCAGISQDAMSSVLASATSLRYLLLTHAGRCFGPKAVKALLKENTGARLYCLSVAGAYLLQDEDVAKLIESHDSTLKSISLKSCPLLGDKFVNAIHSNKNLGQNLLELCLQEMTLSVDQLNTLATSKDALQGITNLTLKSITGLTDDATSKILEIVQESLESLNVSYNYSLTDTTLSSIRQYNPRLKTLILDGIKEFTAAGLETLFTHPLNGLPAPPKLKVLKLASIDHESVTDELIRLVTASSCGRGIMDVKGSSTSSAKPTALTRRCGVGSGGGLVQLDIQGSTLVTDQMLEQLVETSSNTLESLNISYCPLINDSGLGYLVKNIGFQLKKIELWGCAQLTDDFFDGHDRAHDGSLKLIGAWMKKSGTRSLR